MCSLLLSEKSFKYPDDSSRRPVVPKHTEKPLMGLRSNKNHITSNAVENIMSVPKKPEKKFVDTRGGATHPLDPSGLTPKYVNKKDFGKTPVYLERRKAEVERAQKEYNAYVRERFRQGAMKSLTEQERYTICLFYDKVLCSRLTYIMYLQCDIIQDAYITVECSVAF